MSRPDEQLSTRDLASTPAEPRDETDAADDREDVETSIRHDGTTDAGEPTPAAPDETQQHRADRDADGAATAAQREPSGDRAEPAAEPGGEPSAGRAEPAPD